MFWSIETYYMCLHWNEKSMGVYICQNSKCILKISAVYRKMKREMKMTF